MAFIGDIYKEETLVTNYDLTNGATAWTTSNIIQFSNISLQVSYQNVSEQPNVCVYQSNDGVSWDCFYDNLLPIGNDSITIERNNFTGKFIKMDVDDNGIGVISINLVAK